MNEELRVSFSALIALLHEHIKCLGATSELAVGIDAFPEGIMRYVNKINKYGLTDLDAELQRLIKCLSKVELPQGSVSVLRSTCVDPQVQINAALEEFKCGSSQEIAEELSLLQSLVKP
jgi:hypothetical protein